MNQRLQFSLQLNCQEFQQYYWYKQELQEICRQYHLPVNGTKAELTQYILRLLQGEKPQAIKPLRNTSTTFLLTANQITLKTKLLASNFRLNDQARQFFANYFHKENFHFKKSMAIKLRAVQQNQDQNATVQDLVEAYIHPNASKINNTDEEKTYQWNNFVKDFCADPQTEKFPNKLKAAAILWKHVRDSNLPKTYTSPLLTKYAQEINA
ncbi:MAG: SAP domain-containing protein [Lactobacillus sp.]|uniref:SAP domain-containing protein n=1 Tax=Bombilactobacillus bombi TaxID=1303590 RepID=UPI0035EDDA25|nr:SAP domain-containing protein [Lactobacillus sp.]